MQRYRPRLLMHVLKLTVTLHIVDVRLTCLINITYLLTYKKVTKSSQQARWLGRFQIPSV